MTNKKRELIDILLDSVKPEDWPEIFPYAAQDKSCSMVHVYANIPYISSIYGDRWECGEFSFNGINIQVELCKFWNKTIVHRDEFMKRWDERNAPGEAKTPQQLALEKFGTDWHENDGRIPRTGRALIDIEFSNGRLCESELASYWAWELSQSTHITRWRVHSETDTTTPPAQQEHNTEETKSIQQEVKATNTQIGGDHYTKLAIQPMRYSMENGLDALQHTVIKYVTRFRDKNGNEDLEKAKHCIDMLIEYEKENK